MSVTSGTKSESGLGETIRVVIHALLIALVIRTFLFQPFNIPSGSMKATLLVGDYLFVSKFSYGYSRYSFPIDLSFIGMGTLPLALVFANFVTGHCNNLCGEISAIKGAFGRKGYPF